jgi:arylformamidase
MALIDITRPLTAAVPVWPGEPQPRAELLLAIARGDVANVTVVTLGTHAGTHADAPSHFLEGAPGAEAIPPEALLGDAWIADLRGGHGPIGAAEIEGAGVPEATERLLLRTLDAARPGGEVPAGDVRRLDASGAQAVLDLGLLLIGIDEPSVGDEEAHRLLLADGVVPLEGLVLDAVAAGAYRLIATALAITGADGAPVRAFLEPR